MTHTYNIQGMHCGSCVTRIKSELLKLGDVVSAEVGLAAPQATIQMSKHIGIAALQAAVGKAGDFKITESTAIHDMHASGEPATAEKASYYPVYLIFAYVAGVSTLVQVVNGSFNWMIWMSHFMAGFFLVFSFFKLINLRGFADGFRTYDLPARYWPAWAYIYPFAELALGIGFLTGFSPAAVTVATLVIMSISAVGVINSLLQKKQIQCACLGTVIRLPLGTLSLVEDLLMVIMSVWMLWMMG